MNPLPYGKESVAKMGYDVSQLPDQVWESACMCGNSFSLGPVNKGETVVDLGCGAGADLCVSAGLVGETGKVIGVDMTLKCRADALRCLETSDGLMLKTSEISWGEQGFSLKSAVIWAVSYLSAIRLPPRS